MSRHRVPLPEAFARIEAINHHPTRRELATSLGCSVGQAHDLLSVWERRADHAPPNDDRRRRNLALLVPLPRWCQSQRQRPRYRIDDAFPADRDLAI